MLAPAADFSETGSVNDSKHWTVPKWPFLLGDALLLAAAYFLIQQAPHPIGRWEIVTAAACVALGAVLGALPFILDYRAIVKVIEAGALGAIAEKIQNLEKLAAQISAATNEWLNVQTQAEKISNGAKEIADKMAGEVREFSEFMQKMNDSEKAALRLEVEKLRRGEAEWLQVLVRILDHVFALHAAAARSGQPKLAEQIANFKTPAATPRAASASCRSAPRRMNRSTPNATSRRRRRKTARRRRRRRNRRPGFTFQGRLLRPALVRCANAARKKSSRAKRRLPESAPANPPEDENSEEQLPLGTPD